MYQVDNCIGLRIGCLEWDGTCPELDRMIIAQEEEWSAQEASKIDESQWRGPDVHSGS
jgi:hypothetical protein